MFVEDACRLLANSVPAAHRGFLEQPDAKAALQHWLMHSELKPALMPPALHGWFRKHFRVVPPGEFKPDRVAESTTVELPLDWATVAAYPPPSDPKFRFIDLFAGIGGFRIAMQSCGGTCVFSCEWNAYAKKTYEANFGEQPYGDITKIAAADIPDHDVLCAGFPCQPFSLAGVSKKNSLGRKHGFEDETQGTLFFDVARIISEKRPAAFFLENVRNLLSHGRGQTFEVIRRTLEDELGYVVRWSVVDGGNWVPQSRKRVFIVGYDPTRISIKASEIVIPEKPDDHYKVPGLAEIIRKSVPDNHTLGPGTWATLERHKRHHSESGNGFGYGLIPWPIPVNATTRTISARYYKDGAEVLIEQPGRRPRRLTVEEAMRLQGYDAERFNFPVSDVQAYKQIGNSVVVPAVSACAKEIAKVLTERRIGRVGSR